MDANAVRENLGLAADATDEEVTARITQLREVEETASAAPSGDGPEGEGEGTNVAPVVPDGMSLIDNETLTELQVAASRGQEAWTRQRNEDRERMLDDAIKAAKFTRARREHFSALYDADPEGTRAMIEALASGVVPTEEIGGAPADQDLGVSAYPANWLPELAGRPGTTTETGD